MPSYDYLCDAHGAFTARKPMAQYQEPEPCPQCANPAPRVMLTAPGVSGVGKSDGATGSSPAWLGGMKRHGGGCACC